MKNGTIGLIMFILLSNFVWLLKDLIFRKVVLINSLITIVAVFFILYLEKPFKRSKNDKENTTN